MLISHVRYINILTGIWGQVQAPYFTWAESNANEKNPLSSLICIRFGSCEVRRLNLAWDFQDKLLYLVVFSLYSSLFWELRDKRNFKKIHFWPESLGVMSEYWYIERGQTQSRVCARHFFGSQVFKTSDVLIYKFWWKYCKYCFDYFLLAGGDKVG